MQVFRILVFGQRTVILERQETTDPAYSVDLLRHEAGREHQAEPTGFLEFEKWS